MSRKEKLLEKLKEQLVKLEVKKKRFELWQKEIEKKDEKFRATTEELNKMNMWWIKQQRIEDRIEFIENRIKRLEQHNFLNYWVNDFLGGIN